MVLFHPIHGMNWCLNKLDLIKIPRRRLRFGIFDERNWFFRYKQEVQNMKNKKFVIGLMLVYILAFTACGSDDAKQAASNTEGNNFSAEAVTETITESVVIGEEIKQEEIPEGRVVSDLTGEYIPAEIENQRPIAVAVDNEEIALPHYGLTQADIVYEIINSTDNNYVTRLLALVKDYSRIEQFGSIRSARATHCILAIEWNAILCHDGGPFYISAFGDTSNGRNYDFRGNILHNLSGGFARIPNGKAREFTEYITNGEIEKRMASANYDVNYNSYYGGTHFAFVNNVELTNGKNATYIAPPFWHNNSELVYDEETGLYYYSEYGSPHLDPANNNTQLSFKNVIIQEAEMRTHMVSETQKDVNGYMYYPLDNSSGKGYYAVNGKVIPITWQKGDLTSPTKYFDENGNELVLNVGKTYIALVPCEFWKDVVIK